MKESQVIVQRATLLDGDYKRLELALPDNLNGLQPGQALLVRPKQMRVSKVWDPYLRKVWYPTNQSNTKAIVEILTRDHYAPGDVLDVVGPVGKPFQLRRVLRNVLLLAYETPPFPLLMMIPWLLGHNVSVTLVLLGAATNYPTNHLPPEVEVIRNENSPDPLDWPNQVTTIGWADQVFAVVPPGDELKNFSRVWDLFNQRRADISRGYLFGVFQGILPCGVGACDVCLVPTKDGLKHACVDGSAFDLTSVKFR